MLCAKREEKILPPAVINELLAERVAEIEESQMRKIRRKEKDEMRDNLIAELLPRAFSRSARTYAYIDAKEGWLIVDSASRKRAEELVELLRKTIGTLPVVPPAAANVPAPSSPIGSGAATAETVSTWKTNVNCAAPRKTAAWYAAARWTWAATKFRSIWRLEKRPPEWQ